MLKPGMVRPREDEMREPKLLDAMESLNLRGAEEIQEASGESYVTMDWIPYNLMIFHNRSLEGNEEKD